jgi:apolipoprotein N-acyltransferase
MIRALLSGLLLAFSMPGPHLGWLAWFALLPLFGALEEKSPKEAFRLGWLAGIVFFGALLYWLYTLWDWASVFIIAGYAILIAYLGLSWGVFGALYAFFRRRLPEWMFILTVPALWVTLEFARSLTRFGFPWGQMADALYQQLPFVQLVSLTGSWGLSFFVVLVNHLIFLGIKRRRWHYPLMALALVGISFGWGWTEMNRPRPEGRELRIGLVQPNIPQRIRSDPERLPEFVKLYKRLLDELAQGEHRDLVILPESILPAFVLQDSSVREVFTEWARRRQSALLLGTYTHESQQVYNSVAFFSAAGDPVDTYDKVQLVPFSTEYFPGIRLLDQLGFWRFLPIGRLGTLTAGQGFHPLRTELGVFATPICFESIFPQISRTFVLRGAELLVTITNDAWFKDSWALPQHFAKGVFRAVENGRYFVQAANTGISGIIDPKGRILLQSPIEEEVVLRGAVYLLDRQTLYTLWGDWWAYATLIYLGMMIISVAIPRRQAGRSSPAS